MRLVSLMALLVVSAPAVAQDSTPAPTPAAKKICRAAPQTGSIMNKRECHTKAEWDAISQSAQADRDKRDRDLRSRNGGLGISRD